jgi:phospholipase/carboxylesterase
LESKLNQISYRAQRRQLGKLNCVVVQPESAESIRKVMVLCHGFGAPGEDLVGIAQELLDSMKTEEAVQLIFPSAPLSLDAQGMPGARAWWLLSIARLIAAMEEGCFEQIREEVPEGIDLAREYLTETIGIALAETKLTERNLVLGGFSQGAMLAMDVACRGLTHPPAALCLYSGALICEKEWKQSVARLVDCQVFQSHGKQDPILPFTLGLWLRDLMTKVNCKVDFLEFNGPHTIPWEAIERTSQLLDSI